MINYDEVEKLAVELKPKMIIAGASAYENNRFQKVQRNC